MTPDGASLFWSTYKAGGAIRQYDPAVAVAKTVFVCPPEDIPISAVGFANDPWITVALAKTRNIKRVRRDGTGYEEIASNQEFVLQLERTSSHLYWISTPPPGGPQPRKGSIRSFAMATREISTVVSDRPFPVSLNLVDGALYWVDLQATGDKVSFLPSAAGAVATVPATTDARRLVADAQGLVWTTPIRIVAEKLDGKQRVETPWTVVGIEDRCALDASFVYCGDSDASVIVRVPR